MAINIRVNGKIVKNMGVVYLFGTMVKNIMVSGKMTKRMDMVN